MNKNMCALLSFALVIALLPACRDKNEEYRAYSNDGRTKNRTMEKTERRNGEKRNSKKTEREYRTMGGKKVREKTEREEMVDESDM